MSDKAEGIQIFCPNIWVWSSGLNPFLTLFLKSEYIELIAQLEEPSNIEQHKNNKIISQCHHSNCFGKGECIEGRCVCHPGYSGLFCEGK